MSSILPPSTSLESDLPYMPDPYIKFSIEQRISASKHDVFRAWSDPELFKLWIAAPEQQLDACLISPDKILFWTVTGRSKSDTHTLQRREHRTDEYLEFDYKTTSDPRTMGDTSARMSISIDRQQISSRRSATTYRLDITYSTPSMPACLTISDTNLGWLLATKRMSQAVTRRGRNCEGAQWNITYAS